MKKLIFLLLLPLFGFGQVATTKNVDSAIIANINTQAAISAINKFTYYGVTPAQVQAIINSISAYIVSQVATLNFGLPPVSLYKLSPPLVYTGVKNLTISGDSIIAGNGPGITLVNCSNVHITKCKILNGTSVNGAGIGIQLQGCNNILIDSCFIKNVASGVYAISCKGAIVVNGNQFENMLGVYPRGQYVQLNQCSGAGNAITNNKCDNILGASNPEDGISLFKSNGTSASPITVTGNWIRGYGVSSTGSGIMTGDNGGSYEYIANNILVNTGNVGIGVAGGSNITVTSNQVYSTNTPVSNVGIYVYQQYTTPCNTINLSNNLVYWKNASGTNSGFWNANNCTGVTVTNNNWTDTALNANIMPAKIITYQ